MDDLTLSDFINMEIIRVDDLAEVIFDTDEAGNKIRLIGFKTSATLDDFQIAENALRYYNDLKTVLG